MSTRARGLKRPRIDPALAARIPPGQFLTQRWPVLHVGDVPPFDPATWDFRVFGLVDRELTLTWPDVEALPRTTVTADMHCVTRWSALDLTFEGVPVRHLIALAGVKPEARFAMFHGEGGYSANVPIEVVADNQVLLALAHDGAPLTPEHGYPLRLIVPQRYGWKSVKWLRGVEFLAEDRPGFWEQYGYHMNADFLKEERFSE